MNISSEYTFPIFISSTDYNLKDFRAELARFLAELGYRPILSSAEGFPDNSPNLEPWESCLPVLESCFVMILVIDGKYGTPLLWPNLIDFKDSLISPTHGEYRLAHNKNKRMLVFIRKEVMTYYQSYRQTLKNCNKDEDETKLVLEKTLPSYIDFEVLKFVHEVKTSKPIAWIKEFEDITDVKKEVQKKMLNELAEIFLVKNMHLNAVTASFNKILATLTPDEQRKALETINATKPFIETFEKAQILNEELTKAKVDLEATKETNTKEKTKYENKIKKLNNDIIELENSSSQTDPVYFKDGILKASMDYNSSLLPLDVNQIYKSPFEDYHHKCDECGKKGDSIFLSQNYLYSPSNILNKCRICNKSYCRKCWPPLGAQVYGLSASCHKCLKTN